MIKNQTSNFKKRLGVTLCVIISSLFSFSAARGVESKSSNEILLTTKLASGMSLSDKDHARVQAMMQHYESQSVGAFTHLDGDGLIVFNYVVKELERRQMPLEIAFIPLVESGYRPNAKNGQHIGLWQLSPVAAKTFGIHVSKNSDGRLNLIKATAGALDYLEYLNKRFDGDWLLSIAAYNAGEGRVLRSMKKNRQAGKPTDFWSLELPPITKAYIPKVLALSEMAVEMAQLNVPVKTIPELVEVKSSNKSALLNSVKKYGVDDKTLKYFNPSDIRAKDGSSIVILTKELLKQDSVTSFAL